MLVNREKRIYTKCIYMGAVVIIGILVFFLIFQDTRAIIASSNSSNIFSDLISQYETNYNEYNLNRSTNIKLAVNKINGTIILPGEIFSFNDIVGMRTEEAGFKIATVYQDGKVTEGFGGGVCQVSSTIYNATIHANLEIIERKGHLFLPSYVVAGGDAAVADGYIDFKFKNTRKYPIKIICTANNGRINVKIYGQKQANECSVEIKSKNVEVIKYKTIYETDNNMLMGEQKIVQKGKNGYRSKTYKIISLNGRVLAKTIISKDTYSAIDEIIKIGCK